MKNISPSVLRRIECDLTAPAIQARRLSAMGSLFAARNVRPVRLGLGNSIRGQRGLTLDDRKLAAARRAAEMTLWQATGGDVLVS